MARDQVFISYSHKDREWLERLQIMLIPLQRQGTLDVWADMRIQPGQRWKEEIQQALARAKVAVLLVSPDFLASEFIQTDELPPLLEAARTEGLTILWIPVRHSLYQVTSIAHYQAAYDPRTPLATLAPAQQDAALVRIAEALLALPPFPGAPASSPAPAQTPPLTHHDRSRTISKPMSALSSESEPSPQHASPPRREPRLPTPPAGPPLPAIPNIHGWSTHRVQELQQQTALALDQAVEFHDTLRDGGSGPLMVVIPGGRFLMGSPPDEPDRNNNEGQHEVDVAPFAMGKYPVMFDDYDRFAEATRRDTPSDEGWGRGRRPVIHVTWLDSLAYADWLSQQTGHVYRLPTEAEWEYACRAGTTTAYHFSTAIETSLANYSEGNFFKAWVTRLSGNKTVETGRYPGNAWGLYDLHGNVWEWTCSLYDKEYGGGEQRCAAPGSGGPRVLRGGSWGDGPGALRAAARFLRYPDWAGRNAGFRLVRTLFG